MKAQHTPGPWRVQNHWICDSTGLVTVATMPQAGVACENPAINPSDLASEDNARLIAAAPELLEACKELVADLISHAQLGLNEKEVAMLRRAESAIAKAIGQ